MFKPELLETLCCPETQQALAFANAEQLARLNAKIAAGTLKSRSGELIKEPLAAGFIRQDQMFVYPIRNGLPILLIDAALPL